MRVGLDRVKVQLDLELQECDLTSAEVSAAVSHNAKVKKHEIKKISSKFDLQSSSKSGEKVRDTGWEIMTGKGSMVGSVLVCQLICLHPSN